MNTIFVSIASYCDPLLKDTIEDALDNARFPDSVCFGVVEQSSVAYANKVSDAAKKNMRLLSVVPSQSRGACWARALVMAMYGGEDWFFQIDAHTIFDKHWDTCLISSWVDCKKYSDKPYISGYPHKFEIKDGVKIKQPYTTNIVANVVAKDKPFGERFIDTAFTPVYVDKLTPIKGFHVAAGCIFAPGNFVHELPYDPGMYFSGEEPLLALRAFTHGWDVFHVSKLPVYHYYDTGPELEIKRTRHWAEDQDKERHERWWQLNTKANARMTDIINGKNFGVYGLGTVRSLDDYAKFSGIDYKNKTLSPKAHSGPWAEEQ